MKTIGIIFNSEKRSAVITAEKIGKTVRKRGARAVLIPSSRTKNSKIDLAVAIGGDGTILKASEFLSQEEIPVLGVNVGSLGFLVETDPSDFQGFFDNILKGNYHVEPRMMLAVEISKGKKVRKLYALNECMVHSGNIGRVVTVTARVNGKLLGNYIGDGLIVATPTGSTAYSLAAFGPIVHPSVSLFAVTPVCPHTLAQRPIIVPAKGSEIFLTAVSKDNIELPVAVIDGQRGLPLTPEDKVSIKESSKPLQLIVNPDRDYFSVLRAKLKWGERG